MLIQETAEMMCKNEIIGIWNFTPVTLRLPDNIIVENVDMYPSLAVLSHKVADIIDNAFD